MADKNIGSLPAIGTLNDESLLVVEQQGVACKMPGRMFREFGERGVSQYVDAARQSAERAESAQGQAAISANKAVQSAKDAAVSAEKAEKSRQGAEEAVRDAVQDATEEAQAAQKKAEDSALLSKSWATGGTGIREGESADNSRYYAEKAEYAATRAPTIGDNGNWLVWDNELGAYKDSRLPSRGEPGADGQDGADGQNGQDGKNGAVLEGSGLFGFYISEAGDLILHYEGSEAPNMRLNEAGELIYTY